MTDKERIMEILKAYTKKNNIMASSVILEEYAEELVANGFMLPPCKLGDKVYLITLDKTVEEYTVNGVCQYTNGIFVELIDFDRIFDIPAHKVFLTKEEAEEKLKELGE